MHPTLKITGTKSNSLSGKRIVLGITGSIAAVKCVELARELIRHGAEVHAVMTAEAQKILHENAMHYATGFPAVTELTGAIEHVEFFGVEGEADLLLIAPATANTIGKIAQGIDDSTVSSFASTALGSGKPILIVPAMHESMYKNKAVVENVEKLKELGVVFVEPRIEENKAKFPEIEEIVLETERVLGRNSLKGKKVLVSSGATFEELDPIRVLTNKSSGITGREIALEAYRLGAEVSIAHNHEKIASGIRNLRAGTFEEMREAVLRELEKGFDVFVSAAAVTDFAVEKKNKKIKSGKKLNLKLKPQEKILDLVVKRFPEVFVVAFKAETNLKEKELIEVGEKKLKKLRKGIVVVNDVAEKGLGTLENKVWIVSKKGVKKVEGLKKKIAQELWKEIEGALD